MALSSNAGEGSAEALPMCARLAIILPPLIFAFEEMLPFFVEVEGTGNVVVGMKKDWTSGAFNPAAWTGTNIGTSATWAAVTLVLKPA